MRAKASSSTCCRRTFTVVARYAGGHNAGHTVIIHGKKFVLQLVPCGVLRAGCRSVIGNGVVLDPLAFLKEAGALREAGGKSTAIFSGVQSCARDSALSPDDRTGRRKRARTRKDWNDFPRHRSGI